MVYLEIAGVLGGGLIIGILIGYGLEKKTGLMNKFTAEERKKRKIIKNPDLLVEKLNETKLKVDQGEKVSYFVEERDGKKVVVEKREPYKPKKEVDINGKTSQNKQKKEEIKEA